MHVMKIAVLFATLLPATVLAQTEIQVSMDKLTLRSVAEATLVGDGTLRETESYSGPWLDIDRTIKAELDVREQDVNGDTVYLFGRSEAFLEGANAELELFTIAEADFSGLREAPENRLWDTSTPLITESKARFRWEFCVAGKIELTATFVNKGTNGYVSFYLEDKTQNMTLVDFETAAFSFGDTIAEVTLIAGHKYAMKGMTTETNNQDDDEAALQVAFGGDVTFNPVQRLACRKR